VDEDGCEPASEDGIEVRNGKREKRVNKEAPHSQLYLQHHQRDHFDIRDDKYHKSFQIFQVL
jgi:hypothetical protein